MSKFLKIYQMILDLLEKLLIFYMKNAKICLTHASMKLTYKKKMLIELKHRSHTLTILQNLKTCYYQKYIEEESNKCPLNITSESSNYPRIDAFTLRTN